MFQAFLGAACPLWCRLSAQVKLLVWQSQLRNKQYTNLLILWNLEKEKFLTSTGIALSLINFCKWQTLY